MHTSLLFFVCWSGGRFLRREGLKRNWIVSYLGKKLARSHPEVLASTWPGAGWHARRASAGRLVAEVFDWRLHLGVKHEKHEIRCATRPAWSFWPQLPPPCCTSAAQHTQSGTFVGISPPVFPFPQQKPGLRTSWSSRQISPLASQSRMWVNANCLCSLPCDCCCRDSSGDGFGGCPEVFGPRQVAQLFPAPVPRLLAGLAQRRVCWSGEVPMARKGKRKQRRPASPPGIAQFPSVSPGKNNFPWLGRPGELWMFIDCLVLSPRPPLRSRCGRGELQLSLLFGMVWGLPTGSLPPNQM